MRSNNYTQYKSKGNKKILSVDEDINKIKPYLKEIINDLTIQLIITINFISSKHDNDEESSEFEYFESP